VTDTGTVQNFSPAGWQDAIYVLFDVETNLTVGGFAAPTAGKPRIKFCQVIATSPASVTLTNEGASSDPDNRIQVAGAFNLYISNSGWTMIWGLDSDSNNRWRVVKGGG
jgi:hypothetical protein